MRKATMNHKIERRGLRLLGAASLALTFAAFGCTTTRYGEPASLSPSYGPVNHSITPGSSSGSEEISPMASSYTGSSRVNTDVLATLAAEQGFQGRVLGPVDPAGVQTGVPMQPTGGQFVSPALTANPQQSVNSSISSDPNPAITSGTTEFGLVIAAAGTTATGATAATGTTIGTTATTVGTTGAVATTKALTTASASRATTAKSTTATTARTSTAKTTDVAMKAGVSPIRIEAGTTGQVTVTNVKEASTKP
jgi:hypothetical protein